MKPNSLTTPPRVIPSRGFCRDGYPFDFDASLRYGRPRTGWDIKPHPPIIGSLSGFLPLQDAFVIATSQAKRPFGPGATSVPVNLVQQTIVPGLAKTGYRS